MRPLDALTWLCIIRTNAMYTHTFLQTFNRLGLSQWDGIEQDIACGSSPARAPLAQAVSVQESGT